MSRNQTRNWVFTLNNYTESEIKDMETWTDKGVQGIGYEKEVGKEGTPHLQGFIVMNKKASISTLKTLNKRMHLEPMKGRIDHNITYCSKEGNFTKIGKARQTPYRRREYGARYAVSDPCSHAASGDTSENRTQIDWFNHRHYVRGSTVNNKEAQANGGDVRRNKGRMHR